MTDRTFTVTVHKTAIPLLKGESIGQFSLALRAAGREHVLKQFNINPKKGGAFPMEVYSNKAVFSVVPDMTKDSSSDFMVALTFKRGDTGGFSFTDVMKVKAVTRFEPADGVPLTKALDMDGWTPDEEPEVKGSLWGGVI